MIEKDRTEEIASTHLGKRVEMCDQYNPDLLVAVPRIDNRRHYNIDNNNLPFEGWDIWHAYEFSALTENGLPVTRLLKIKYNCTSEFIIESKSLKLYLNSYNMTRLGENISKCLNICKEKIEKDLSDKLKTNVTVKFLDNDIKKIEIFQQFRNILDFVDEKSLKINHFKESPELLEAEDNNQKSEHRIMFDSLRSNCRVTHQPDFGDVFIYYKSKKHIKEHSLVKYLCSFRSEYHFHEECCEMIYKRLYDLLDKDDELFVSALYTRRGGIDICPTRWSKNFTPKEVADLIDTSKYARCGIKQ